MPTIDQLTPAAAASDMDEIPVSQNGLARRVTRAQLVAGTQSQLGLTQGQLLGRSSPGNGGPEPIALGANLTLVAGTLSAAVSPFSVSALPRGNVPSSTDLVAIGQSGNDVAIPVSQLMAGMAGSKSDISSLGVTAAGTTFSRPLREIAVDYVVVEAFGAKGDGISDDTAAISAAVASGYPVRFGPRTYIVNGQFVITTPHTTLLGTAGQTVLKRLVQTGAGAWISVQADDFRADGISFDANRSAVRQESWGVLVTALCLRSDFDRCMFQNASGASLGSGLVFLATDPTLSRHAVRNCEFQGNAAHGIWVQACAGVLVEGCRAHDNAQYGINIDFNDPTFVQKARLVQVIGCRAWNNLRGITVGNFNIPNTSPPVWGNSNPDALSVLVVGNTVHDNSIYGIAVSGRGLSVQDNTVSGNGNVGNSGAGILANVAASRVCGNMVSDSGLYGIDCGGSIASDFSDNMIDGAVLGINCGGSTDLRVSGNVIQNCSSWTISINNVETDGFGNNFNISCNRVSVKDNYLNLPSASAGGIQLRDGPQNILVSGNDFVGGPTALIENCLYPATDSLIVEGNRWNFAQARIYNPYLNSEIQQITYPDIVDRLMITYAPQGVQAMVTSSQSANYGQLTFIRMTDGGAGYTQAAIVLGGSGTGAAAIPMISNGSIIGCIVTKPGEGYGAIGTTWPVTIAGDGTGAAGLAFAGMPLLEGRRLSIHCNCPVKFSRAGSRPLQENWTAYDLTVAANSDVNWTVTYGMWRAANPTLGSYVASDGSGGTILRSPQNGDVALHPDGAGHIRLASDAEPYGCFTTVGRGSPEGIVTAPQGSDFRNLQGGIGSTFWIKRSGSGNTGWFAVA